MKKLILSFALVLTASLVSGQALTKEQIKAQKKEQKALMLKVKTAEKAIVNGDNAGALNMVQDALKSPLTNTNAYVWYVASKAKKGVIDGENYKRSQAQPFNAELMYNSAYDIFDYLIKCDQYDKAPNAKGKVAPKYSLDVVTMMYENRNQLFNGGAYFYNAEKFDKAFDQFDMFIKTAALEPLDTLPAVKDKELNSNAAYYAALCGMQTENYKNVLAHIDLAIENPDYKENATRYKAMAQAELADTTAWLQTLKMGAKNFPKNPFFYQCLIQYYQNKNKYEEILKFADEMIASNPDNALFYSAKGIVLQENKKLDEAIVYYKKALEKDADDEGALFNLGKCYIDLAQEYSQKNSSTNINDKAKIKKDKEILNDYYKEALPLYEKLRKLQPGKVEHWGPGLGNCYHNLNMAKEAEEVAKLLESSMAEEE